MTTRSEARKGLRFQMNEKPEWKPNWPWLFVVLMVGVAVAFVSIAASVDLKPTTGDIFAAERR